MNHADAIALATEAAAAEIARLKNSGQGHNVNPSNVMSALRDFGTLTTKELYSIAFKAVNGKNERTTPRGNFWARTR